jgi:hypothetical protein
MTSGGLQHADGSDPSASGRRIETDALLIAVGAGPLEREHTHRLP